MTDLCKNCGHALPNAAGVGLYCTECGEPVKDRGQTMRIAAPPAIVGADGISIERPDTGLAIAGDALELLDALHELAEQLLDDDFSEYADELRLINSRHDAVVRRYNALRGRPSQ